MFLPVGRGGHGEGLGADLEREDLAGNDPSDWTPRAGEEEDVDAHEGDQRLVCDHRIWQCCADASDDKLTDTHPNL